MPVVSILNVVHKRAARVLRHLATSTVKGKVCHTLLAGCYFFLRV